MKTKDLKLGARYAFDKYGSRYVGTLVETGVGRTVYGREAWARAHTSRDGCRFENVVRAAEVDAEKPEYHSGGSDGYVVPPQKVLHPEADEVVYQTQRRASMAAKADSQASRKDKLARIAAALGIEPTEAYPGAAPYFDGLDVHGFRSGNAYGWIEDGITVKDRVLDKLLAALEAKS